MAELAPPEARGELTLTERAVGKVARHALNGVPGIAGGSHAPRVSSEMAGDRARFDVEIAVEWPTSAAGAARAAADALHSSLVADAGLHVDDVTVTVVDVVPVPLGQRRRVS